MSFPNCTARLFLDTEFTGFVNPQLLSLGLVLDESNDFYGELNVPKSSYEENDFVDEHVLSQWGKAETAFASRVEMVNTLVSWFASLGSDKIEVHYDYHTDMDLLEALLVEGNLWETWKDILVPTHVAYLYGDDRVEPFMDECWSVEKNRTGLKPHHALADARVLRKAFFMVHDGVGL